VWQLKLPFRGVSSRKSFIVKRTNPHAAAARVLVIACSATMDEAAGWTSGLKAARKKSRPPLRAPRIITSKETRGACQLEERGSRVIGVTLLLCAALFPHARASSQTSAQPSIAFDRDIRPILEGKCVSCHGGALQLSKLDLRTRETALSGGARGAVLVPGNAERSRLYRMVAGLEQPAMPMQGRRSTGHSWPC
jgi:hypothetical protein